MYSGKFEPPGPGSWELETTHMTRPLSRWLGEVFPEHMMRGFKEATARYGALLDHLEMQVVEGFIYSCPRPVGAPKTAKGPPPPFVFKLLSRLHPAMRKRNKQARITFETKLWREDVARWDNEWKPQVIADNAKLAAVDPSTLDRAALIAHVDAAHARMCDAVYRHHSLNICTMLPIGDLFAHVKQWTGCSSQELCELLKGYSPVSAGAVPELARLVAAIRADASAQATLDAGRAAGEVLAALRGHAGEVGAAMRAYVDLVGLRMVSGADVGDPYALEVPEVLIGAIRAALRAPRGTDEDPRAACEARAAALRARVPAEHRALFDELLAEARHVYRVRDERGLLNDAPASGIARRALLAAGDMLVADGKLASREDAVELRPAEVLALLRGESGPSAAELAGYRAYRQSKAIEDAPEYIGFPPSPPPSAELLPGAAARMMRAVELALSDMFHVPKPAATKTVVRGLAASAGSYEGRARVVRGLDEFGKIEKGDVLIARNTSPSYNVLLPLLGGIVTDRGGVLCHAAIVAREYGMPAVVGTSNATNLVPDGARVRIDGATGEVQVLT